LEIEQYLKYEEIRPFLEGRSYWKWATRMLGSKAAKQLAEAMNERAQGDTDKSTEFYDFLARPDVMPVVASFERGLLVQIANWVVNHLPLYGTVVELGCHTGLLTRFYALARPDVTFIGIDRSEQAIQVAQKMTQAHKIVNLKFVVSDILVESLSPNIKADCIITGRVIGNLMSMVLRRRVSWKEYQYPSPSPELDPEVRIALRHCMEMLTAAGTLLVTERLSSFDRLYRLWQALQDQGCKPELQSITPVNWQDISGHNNTWFFQAQPTKVKEISQFEIMDIPLLSKEYEAIGQPTRLMLDGILAWQTWNSLMDRKVTIQEALSWESGEEIHYEIGTTGPGLGYAYVASNTDINLLTLFLPQESEKVQNDMKEYGRKLKSSGAQTVKDTAK
jgi:SAM-dependent methyltransferase